jgi:tetratricopeptide (TPR) repeat protein
MTQQRLAGDRYTKAYVSALENGLVRPSMAALDFFANQLGLPASRLISDETPAWHRVEADIHLAAGRWAQAVDAYTSLLDQPAGLSIRAELLRGRAEGYARLNQGLAAAGDAAEAVRLFTAAGREADEALATYWLAYAQYEQGNTTEARSLMRDVLDRVRGGLAVEPDFNLRLLLALSATESKDGDHAKALAYLQEVRAMADHLDDRRRGTYLFDLAVAYQETGDIEAAIRTGFQSLALYRATGAESEMAALENTLALAFLANGTIGRARELVDASRARFERLNDAWWLAHVDDTAAQIDLADGRVDEALELTARSIETAERTQNQRALTSALISRARTYQALGEFDEAISCFERAADLARNSTPRGPLREVLGQWAELLAKHGDHEQAYALTREALSAG